jgi:TIR domain
MAGRSSPLIFISYRGSDENWATELVYKSMKDAFGADAVFKAGYSLQAGEEFPATLRSEAASCPVMLACIGPGWLTATAPDGSRRLDSPDDWVREEIAISLRSGNRLVPLLLGNRNEVQVPKPDRVPAAIRPMVERQAVWLAPGRALEHTVSMLVDQLAELVPELAERRRGQSPAEGDTTMIQRNDVSGGGLLGAAQGGSVYVSAGAAAPAPAGDGRRAPTGRRPGMSLEGELASLAEAAAVALVTAMGTNAWTSVRDAAARVFRRGGASGPDTIGGRLDDHAALVAAADDQAEERAALEPFWRLRFRELVKAEPGCAVDLAELIGLRDNAARPAAGQHLEQHTTVRDSGRAFVAQGGNVIMHGDPAAPRSAGAAGHPGGE